MNTVGILLLVVLYNNTLHVCTHLYRQQRMAEIMAAQQKAKYGSVKEITAVDYVDEVNKAGDGVWVILHLYRTGYPFNGVPVLVHGYPWSLISVILFSLV